VFVNILAASDLLDLHTLYYSILHIMSTKIKSALVIGGCGSLGHRTVEQLLKLKPTPQVAVFDIQTKVNIIDEGVDYYDVDVTNK
jgi:FlaA1/EpsC-like NDP-sugar epimerase